MTRAYLPVSVRLNDSIHAQGRDSMDEALLISCLMWKTAVQFKLSDPNWEGAKFCGTELVLSSNPMDLKYEV